MKPAHAPLPMVKPLVLAIAMGSQQLYAECLSDYTVTKTTNASNDIATLQGAFTSINNNCSNVDVTVTIADDLAGEPIGISEFTLNAYDGERITVVGPTNDPVTLQRGSTFSLFNTSEGGQISLKNLILDGNLISDNNPGLDIQSGSQPVLLENVTAKHFGDSSDSTATSSGGVVKSSGIDVSIIDSVFEENNAGLSGGAVYVEDANLNIEGSTFNSNTTSNPNTSSVGGGAIAFASTTHGKSLIIADSQFDSNFSHYRGGAIFHENKGSINISESTFNENQVDNWHNSGANAYGGALYLTSVDESSIRESSFTNNESDHQGGAIFFSNQDNTQFTELEIVDTVFEGNSANLVEAQEATSDGHGAALYITDSSESEFESGKYNTTVTLDQVTMSSNTAQGSAGALYMNIGSLPFAVNISDSTFASDQSSSNVISSNAGHTLTIKRSLFLNNQSTVINASGEVSHKPITIVENSTFTGNTSTYGLITYSGAIGPGSHVKHSTITGNTSTNAAMIYGGGVSGMEEDLVVSHTILSNNSTQFGQVCNLGEANMDFSIEYTFIDNADISNTCRTTIDNGGNQLGTEASPLDPLLNELADNGGHTQTMLLATNSPVMDAGNPNIENAPETDQRGNSRILRGQIDIGAVEMGNNLPVYQGETSFTLDVSESISIDIDLATDADDDSLTYSVSGLPEGITFDENLNTISGTISEAVYDASTTYNITVTISDGYGDVETILTVNLTDDTGLYDEEPVVEPDPEPTPEPDSNTTDEEDTNTNQNKKSSGFGALNTVWMSILSLILFRRRF